MDVGPAAAAYVRAGEVRPTRSRHQGARSIKITVSISPSPVVSNPLSQAVVGPDGRSHHVLVEQAPVATLSLPDLRERRHRLVAEAARAGHWRRLAQARLDLTVADALADDLSAPHASAVQDAPCFDSLRALVIDGGADGRDVVTRLHQLDEAERLLRGYDTAVRAAVEEATLELVRRYSSEPAACLTAVPRAG